jgi:hypothetical protein
MRHLLFTMTLIAFIAPARAETSATSEFLRWPEDRQTAYVAGVLQGVSYLMSNYDKAGYQRWGACVHAQSLEATVVDVLRLLKENPNESSTPVPWAVVKAISRHC